MVQKLQCIGKYYHFFENSNYSLVHKKNMAKKDNLRGGYWGKINMNRRPIGDCLCSCMYVLHECFNKKNW